MIRSPRIPDTALEPSRVLRKKARIVATASGWGMSFKTAFVTIPSVPSDPTSILVRSYPTTPFTVDTPVRTSSPVPRTASSPNT